MSSQSEVRHLRLLCILVIAASLGPLSGCNNGDEPTFTLAGKVVGLASGENVSLQTSASSSLVVSSDGAFAFPKALMNGAGYSVSIVSQPAHQMCAVTNGTGIINLADVTNVIVNCSFQTFSLSGTIQGLTGSGLIVADGTTSLTVASGASKFTLPMPLAYGGSYSVGLKSQPAGETCTVSNGSGTMVTGNVTNVLISCTALSYSLSGTISGLTKAGLILANGSSTLRLAANATTFTMPLSVSSGSSYNLTVQSNPVALSCTVTNGAGTVMGASISNVAITCQPGTESILYAFGGSPDAGSPGGSSGLMQASDGNFYGMTYGGGSNNLGAIFRVAPSGAESLVYSFKGDTDGARPLGSLIQGTNGLLYGMTSSGGEGNYGVIFSVALDGSGEQILYAFTGGSDGGDPLSSLMQASNGNFYGMTNIGGANEKGVIFELSSDNSEKVIWSFGGSGDGELPYGSLIQGSDGNLYGVTAYGGVSNRGCIFKYNLAGGSESVLYSFQKGVGGSWPAGSLIQANDGNLYGMTAGGGTNGQGVVFQLNPSSSTPTEAVVYTFSLTQGDPGYGSLIQADDGNLYGFTSQDLANPGTLFELTLSGNFTVLWSFGIAQSDGVIPLGSLVQGADGNLYGMTAAGGSYGGSGFGTVFKFN
jgi:uncharacterized repeat protein (TIGR03803 family)